ncbi:MAG: histidinol-phosphate transaminase [Ruminococcus sp.]
MSRYLRENLTGLEAYTPGEQPRDGEYIKLNTNESPYPPAKSVVKALEDADIERLRLYSDPTCKALKEKLAALYKVKSENIFLSNGSDDILNFAFMAFGAKGAVFPDITYGFYTVFAELHSVEYEELPLNESFDIVAEDYYNRDKLIVIANPNAPTGKTISVKEIENILIKNKNSVVVIDEAYVDFGGESAYPLIDKYDNLLVVRTYSKSRSMAGARLGYAIASKGIIEDLERLKYSTNPYNINSLTLKLGEATLDAEDYYFEKCKEISLTREYTTEKLEERGFEVLPSKSNFIFARHKAISGEALYTSLKERKILVRHFTKERIKDFNRITIGTKEQMNSLLDVIDEILGGN